MSKDNSHRSLLFPIILGLCILIIDQISKWLVQAHISPIDENPYIFPYGGIPVFANFFGIEFSINHMTNSGAAWGFFGSHPSILLIIRLILIISLTCYLFCFNRHPAWRIPLICVIAGATGNVLDYFIYGHVIDMFHFILWGYDFPVFNVADASISIGIAALFLLSWKKE